MTGIVKVGIIEIKEKEEQKITDTNDFLDDKNLPKKRKSENIDSIERKRKKESIEIGENLQFDGSENKDFEKNGRKLKGVSTGAGTVEGTTLASLPSDRQTPVLECLKGRLVTIERSCKYFIAARTLHSTYHVVHTKK